MASPEESIELVDWVKRKGDGCLGGVGSRSDEEEELEDSTATGVLDSCAGVESVSAD